jgi:hypothetical protein
MVELTKRLHGNHVLGAHQRQLDDLEQGVTHALDRFDAGAPRQQDDVEPGEEHGEPHREEDQEEPDDRPQDSRTRVARSAAGSFSHLPVRISRGGGLIRDLGFDVDSEVVVLLTLLMYFLRSVNPVPL